MDAVSSTGQPVIHDRVHTFGGDQRSRVSRMPRPLARLSAALAPTASHALLTGESIRRGWFRGNGGVLVAQRQLSFEIGDLRLGVGDVSGRLHQLPLTLDQLAAQPCLGLRAAPSLRLRHALRGTPVGSTCTDPEL